jgi:N-acetyltransferase
MVKHFDLQPTLVGPKLLLRPLEPADFDALFAVARDPLLWALHPAHDRWQEPVFRKLFEESIASGGALVIVDSASGQIIGSSRYDFTRAGGPDEIEIGWTFLARSHWGGDTNAAMKRLMLTHALATLERVIFVIGADNKRSRRAMDKIGGRLTERTLDITMAGRVMPHVVYAIDRDGYAQGLLTRYPV